MKEGHADPIYIYVQIQMTRLPLLRGNEDCSETSVFRPVSLRFSILVEAVVCLATSSRLRILLPGYGRSLISRSELTGPPCDQLELRRLEDGHVTSI
jgi:hypothetical protein